MAHERQTVDLEDLGDLAADALRLQVDILGEHQLLVATVMSDDPDDPEVQRCHGRIIVRYQATS